MMIKFKEKHKILLMAFLLVGAGILTYYFLKILGTSVVFTHLFYIPIILAAFWWKRKGLVIAVFLVLMLYFSHIFIINDLASMNDHIRSLLFILSGVIVATLSEKISKSEAVLKTALNSMNYAISIINVNDFKIVNVNSAFLKDIGKTEEEVIGQTCYKVTHYRSDPCTPPDHICPLPETVKNREYSVAEHVYYGENNEKKYVEISASPIKDEKGKIIQVVHISQDITERKLVEQEIPKLRQYNRGLIEASLDPLMTFDKEGIIQDVNEATIQATGSTREELIGTPFADYFTDPDKAYKGAMLTFETGEVRDYELVIIARDGTETIVTYNASVYKDQTGKVVGAFAAARDFTERKNADIALRESKAKVDLIFQIAANGMCVIDADSNIVKVNEAFIQMMDMDEDEIIGRKCYDIFSGELCHSEDCPLEKLKKGEQFSEYECVKKRSDGKEIPVILNAARLEQNGKFVGIVEDLKDITEHELAEEKLNASEEKYSTLVEKGNDGIIIIQDSVLKFVNSRMIEFTGFTKDEVIGKPFFDYVSSEYKEMLTERVKKRLKGEAIPSKYEIDILSEDGSSIPVEINASLIEYEGRPADMAIIRDITERRQAEKALIESEERLKTLINSAQDGILIADIETKKFVYSNPAFCNMLGYSMEELMGMDMSDIHPKDQLEYIISEFESQARNEKTLATDIPCLRKDGTIFYADINTTCDLINGRKCNLGFFRDITERKLAGEKLEKINIELKKADKLVVSCNTVDI